MERNFLKLIDKPVKTEKKILKCEKHGEYSADCIYFSDGNYRATACPKCIEEAENAEKKERKKKQESKWREQNIEPEFFGKTFDDFIPKSQSQQRAVEAVKSMVSRKSGKVVLVGSNGVGKTMLASIAAKELGGYVYSMYEISAMIRQSYTVKAVKSELEIVRELSEVPFLAIDELGRSKVSDSEQNWLSYILDKRHTRNLPFMLMSNGHFKKYCKLGGCPKCFENLVDNDILSRLHQNSAVVVIDAPDERTMKPI